MQDSFATIDEYIASLPDDVQGVLKKVRKTIRHATPKDAAETISYDIPTITLGGKRLVYFAGWKHHIALYGIPTLKDELEEELAPYRVEKGTVRFPLAKPMPYDLIERVVASIVKERAAAEANY